MAAPQRYPQAHEQLVPLARAARAQGLTFDEFWEQAVRPRKAPVTWATPESRRPPGAVVWPRDSVDRSIAIAVTKGAKDGWRRAYDRVPPHRAEAALDRLRPVLDRAVRAVEGVEDAAAPRLAVAA